MVRCLVVLWCPRRRQVLAIRNRLREFVWLAAVHRHRGHPHHRGRPMTSPYRSPRGRASRSGWMSRLPTARRSWASPTWTARRRSDSTSFLRSCASACSTQALCSDHRTAGSDKCLRDQNPGEASRGSRTAAEPAHAIYADVTRDRTLSEEAQKKTETHTNREQERDRELHDIASC